MNSSEYPKFLPSGEAGILVEFSDEISDEVNARIRLLMHMLEDVPGIVDTIPAYSSLLVQFDPLRIRYRVMEKKLRFCCSRLSDSAASQEKTVHVIPVLYDGEDLPFVAQNAALSEEEVISLHTGKDYLIYMLGFLPGFAYLGGLDERLHTPRLSSPRTRIPAGSVGIGGKQTGIYPLDSPGGWRLIGRTPLKPYDPDRPEPFLYQMGDYIRFVSVSPEEFGEIAAQVSAGTYEPIVIRENAASSADGSGAFAPLSVSPVSSEEALKKGTAETAPNAEAVSSSGSFLTVLQKGLQMTVQDHGRIGWQSKGFSVSGCMDRQALMDANCLLGNSDSAAVIEMLFMGGSFRFHQKTRFCLTGASMHPALNGTPISMYTVCEAQTDDVLTLGASEKGRYGYLAVEGGIDVPPVLGSRSTNLKCRLGGFQGRALQIGDCIPIGSSVAVSSGSVPSRSVKRPFSLSFLLPGNSSRSVSQPEYLKPGTETSPVMIRVLPGSQEDRFAGAGEEAFFSGTYTVSTQSDRMGYRMDGPEAQAPGGVDILSDGTVFGSVQIPASGKPIVLLSDRQTTGGYAKIGAVIQADLPKLVQCMPGTSVRFVSCSLKEAEKAYRRAFG